MSDLPDCHWGPPKPGALGPDWRKGDAGGEDPDDTLLPETPPDVVAILGFDPLDEPDNA